ERPEEVAPHLDKARAVGITRVISVGGDGTNHALINALVEHNLRTPELAPMVYGNLPVGTGRDWARGIGLPFNDPQAAARQIAHADLRPLDIGVMDSEHGTDYFLNIASVGMSSRTVERIERVKRRHRWTFLQATIATILELPTCALNVSLDGDTWYDGRTSLLVVANGTTFGHGLKVAPLARMDDGLLDVLVIRDVSRWTVLRALQSVYAGKHLSNPAVQFAQARRVEVHAPGGIGLEYDGEPAHGEHMTFSLRPGALQVLA
ncbi:MAG TPA: diacylglycerol kinase family protein, partial [Candidatus Limnocylindrales bacterium]|nr:diacylglycerol kinase family protein [Candidatus Limnocylindrales bacterium]